MDYNPIETAIALTHMTDEDLARLIGVSRQTIGSYKKNPASLPAEKLLELSRGTGISLDKLLSNTKPFASPNIPHTYADQATPLVRAIREGTEARENIRNFEVDDKPAICVDLKKQIDNSLGEMLSIARLQSKKPNLACMGLSDTGKSTVINYLLGTKVAPAAYTPMTSAPTYFVHVNERPDLFATPKENAVVFGRTVNSKISRFNHDLIGDMEYTKDFVLKTGDAASILNAYGTRNGAFYEDDSIIIDEIVVYIDAPILEEVTIIDYPGFGTGEAKDDVSLTIDMSTVDILFFLSRANGFFSTEGEKTALAHVLTSRSDVSALYILATHAHSIGDPNEMNGILDSGCKRLIQILPDDACKRIGISNENNDKLRKRFFAFSPQLDVYCRELNSDLKKTIPQAIETKLTESKSAFFNAVREKEQWYSSLLGSSGGQLSVDRVISEDEIDSVLSSIDAKYEGLKASLADQINSLRQSAKEDFKVEYDKIINVQFIQSAIKRKGFKNRKKDIEALGNYISQELNESFVQVRDKYGNEFVEKLKEGLTSYQEAWTGSNIVVSMKDFNFICSFASGLTGLTAFGALSLWAAAVAAGSNLGAYILVAKVVAALSAIGINLGGTAAVITFIASIGGPVTIGIALAVIAAAATFGILSGTWESRVSKKLVREFEKENALQNCLASIDTYWDDTKAALVVSLSTMHSEAKEDYSKKAHAQNLDYEEKIKINTVSSMLYKLARKAYQRMGDTERYTPNELEDA